MEAQLASGVVVRGPDQGRGPATWAMGSLFERLVSGEETGGLFDASLVTQPPGIATPLHIHTHEAEAFYVLQGTMTYRAGEQLHQLAAGSFIYLPRGVPHAFRITGTTPVRFLGLVAPAGLMRLYDEVGMPARERRLPGSHGFSMGRDPALGRDRPPVRPPRGRASHSGRHLRSNPTR